MTKGLISTTDAAVIQKTIDLILSELLNEPLCITEVGLYNCETSVGIYEYVESKNIPNTVCFHGIDNEKDKPISAPRWMNFIKGNSIEVYNKLPFESQHLIFIDGNHSFPYVIADFFCYETKVKRGGYFVFHDTGKHIRPFKDYQGIGSTDDCDMYISVRKALKRIGLLNNKFREWRLVFDEADENDEAGGVVVLKKVF